MNAVTHLGNALTPRLDRLQRVATEHPQDRRAEPYRNFRIFSANMQIAVLLGSAKGELHSAHFEAYRKANSK